MTFLQCRAYLEKLQWFGIKLGLENIRTVLSSFGDPHHKFPSVLVAGTNGKGSVCAMLARLLVEDKLKVGLYTSPHLVNVEERIRIGEKLISRKDFCRLLGLIRRKIEGLLGKGGLECHPTYFEVLTILAQIYFAEQKVDMAVLEVGMGGRFDATNTVSPLVSVITSVSEDHQEYLGTKIGQIAFEKAGIIKPGVPVICGIEGGKAYRVVRKRAKGLGAPFLGVFDEPGCFEAKKLKNRYRFRYRIGGKTYRFSPRLRGAHQGRNAAVAIAAASVLSNCWRTLDQKKIIRGIESADWEGRLEVVCRKPDVILDGAHNEGGARTLKAYIKDFVRPPVVLVFGMMKDKNIKRVADLLFPAARRVILTSIPYSRAASPAEIWLKARKYGRKIVLEHSLKKAIDKARAEAGPQGTVFITGSIFLVGEAKKALSEAR
jgi:dihydrofolate synthase/folylpolyglutamate synthase